MDKNEPDELAPLLLSDVEKAPEKMGGHDEVKKEDKAPKIEGKTLAVVSCILMCELCERLTYYSVIANLLLFCTDKLDLSSSDAATISLVFSGKDLTLSCTCYYPGTKGVYGVRTHRFAIRNTPNLHHRVISCDRPMLQSNRHRSGHNTLSMYVKK